jgi:heme o synthase
VSTTITAVRSQLNDFIELTKPRIALLVLVTAFSAVAITLLFVAVNPLTAVLTALTIACCVLVYTLWLKRPSSWCTAIGGIAGALPPVLGWAAVSNEIGRPAMLLFTMILVDCRCGGSM